MKKPKISMDSAKMQAFFLNHVEKILLGVMVLLMLLLIYQGFSLKGLDGGKDPKGLIQASNTAMQHIDNSERWNEVKEEKKKLVDMTVAQKVKESQLPTNPLQYFLTSTLKRPDFPKLSPRQDPKLFPPIHLVIHPVLGPVASLVTSPTELDPLVPLPPADAPIPKKKKAKPADLAGAEGGMPGDGAMPQRGKRPKRGAATEGMPGEGGYMPGGMGESGMMMPRVDDGWLPVAECGNDGCQAHGGDGGYGCGAVPKTAG
jgi:hypothetical protein